MRWSSIGLKIKSDGFRNTSRFSLALDFQDSLENNLHRAEPLSRRFQITAQPHTTTGRDHLPEAYFIQTVIDGPFAFETDDVFK